MADSRERDAADPLAAYRDRFVGAETPLVYFDGNSLGRPLKVTGPRLAEFVEHEWGGRLIRGWDERWFDLPRTLGDRLGEVCLGAAPGQVAIGDSTTVLLYKLMRAAVAARPGRTEIVLDRDQFPTDRYVADGVAAETGLALRWIEVDTNAGVTAEQLAGVVGPQTALVVLNHVAYRSAWLADVPELTRIVHDAGALVLWDLCHSAGVVPVELDAWGVDLAVGCTYKYLNGGPGSPAFLYVASRWQEELTQPIQGWMGADDPFLMGPSYVPAAGIRRFLSGTPAVVGMLALEDMVDLVAEAGLAAIRAKSEGLTAHAVEVSAEVLAPLGVVLASPLDPGPPRRPRHPQPPTDARGHGGAVAARRDPRLPRPARAADRALAALDVVRRGAGRARSRGCRASVARPAAERLEPGSVGCVARASTARRDAVGRAGHRLVLGTCGGSRELGTIERLVGAVVPEPVLTGLEALDHRVPGGLEVRAGVLCRGGVAAADVAALGAAAQVHPPAAGGVAVGAAGAARRDGGVDALVDGHGCAVPPR